MSRDASGNFNLPAGNPVLTNTVIESQWANPTMADIAAGLTDSLSRSGKGGMAAPLAMGGYKITALAAATIGTDAPQALQLRDATFNRLFPCTSDATGNNYSGVAVLTAPLVNGSTFLFVADKTNTGAMSLQVNAGAVIPIFMNGAAIPPGIILSGAVISVMFLDLTWRLTNTAGIVGTVNSVQSDNLPAISVTNDFANAVAVLNIHANISNGLAQLDSNAKIPIAQMPFTALRFVGYWNAGPGTLPPVGVNGDFYTISGAGNLTLFRVSSGNNYTAQVTAVNVGDNIVYNTIGTAAQPVGWYFSPAPGTVVTAANVTVVPTPSLPGASNAQAWFNQADPIIAGKLSKSGGTMTGPILQPAAPASAQALANKQYVDDTLASIPAAVNSFNTRTGAITLISADVTSALGFVPANSTGQAFTGPVSATAFTSPGTYTGKGYSQTALVAPSAASQALDYGNGQSQILTLSAATVFTAISNIPVGTVLRLTLIGTNFAITWPASIHWPLGAVPDLTLGPLKKAIVVIENDGTTLLASSAAY
jgi:hypothetical protein